MTPTQPIVWTLTLAALLPAAGCSDSSSDSSAQQIPAFEPDTSYLDDLAEEEGIDTAPASTAQGTAQDRPASGADSEPEKTYEDEDREWVAEDGSKSLFGRARDRAKDVGEQLQNSTQPENGIANTTFDEEYAQAAGFAWDMPEDWRMAVPSSGYFAEMYIQNPLGNASVVFSKTDQTAAQIKRTLESTISDTFGGRTRTQTSDKTVNDFEVTVMDLQGTYIDPEGKGSPNGNPFYAIHAVLIELPTARILIKLWGPQDTVEQNKAKFDAMIEQMYER